ncbi:hypothetical protein P7K49_024382 [Saguinus oedipus]|nr:hypothetical protein P7K49_024382 [Saguinus oedipus]
MYHEMNGGKPAESLSLPTNLDRTSTGSSLLPIDSAWRRSWTLQFHYLHLNVLSILWWCKDASFLNATTSYYQFRLIEIMAGPEADEQFQFTGIKKYFNSYTLTGRRNCVLATYGGIALIILYFKLRSKKTPAVKAT